MDLVVTSGDGMKHHAFLFAKNYGLKFVSTPDSKNHANIYQLGIYSQEEFENIVERKSGRVILHWCGNDCLLVKDRFKRGKWVGSFPDFVEHVAQSQRIVEELRPLGIKPELMLRFTEKRENYPLTILPEEFKVLVFRRADRERFYMKETEKLIYECPDIQFVLVGFEKDEILINRNNVKHLKYVSLIDDPIQYREILKNTSCLVRFNRDVEGFSQVIMQMLLLGRSVLSNVKQEYIEYFDVKDKERIICRLRELRNIKEANKVASDFYHSRQDVNNFDFLTSMNV